MKKRSREINVFSVSALDLFASALGAFILMSLIFMVFFTMTARESTDESDAQAAIVAAEFALCESDRDGALEALAGAQSSLAQCQLQVAGSVDAGQLSQCEVDRNLSRENLAQCREQLSNSVDSASLAQCEANLAAGQARMEDLQRQVAEAGAASAQLQEVSAELRSCQEIARRGFLLVLMSWSSSDDVDLHVVDPAGREFYFAEREHGGSRAALEEDNINGPGNEVWLHPVAEQGRYRVCFKLYTRRGFGSVDVRGSVLWQDGSLEIPNQTLRQEDEVRLATNIVVDGDGNVSLDRGQSGQNLGTGQCA